MARPRGRYSRLAKKEEARNLRRAILLMLMTLALIVGLGFFGVPLFTKMALFLGEIKDSSLPVEKDDLIAPAPPTFEFIPEATSSATIKLKGYAEPEARIEIYLNGLKKEEILADADGAFEFNNFKLNKGTNLISAFVFDQENNQSQSSKEISVELDNEPPEINISEPSNGAQFFWPQEEIVIKGQTEPQSSLSIEGHFVILADDGTFEYPYRFSEGENKLMIIARDQAGNQTELEFILHYSL